MNVNDIYGSDDAIAGGNTYQPIIDYLRRYAQNRMQQGTGGAVPSALSKMEPAGSQGGQMMGPEAIATLREMAARGQLGQEALDWLNQGGMMQQQMQQPQPSGHEAAFEAERSVPANSTPLSRLSDRIDRMGLTEGQPPVQDASPYGQNRAGTAGRRRVSYDDPTSYLFRTAVDRSDES